MRPAVCPKGKAGPSRRCNYKHGASGPMSAICGIVGEAAAGGRGRRDVSLMLELLKPRAPDGTVLHEQVVDGRPLVFGARQLAVGGQPKQPAVGRGADPATFAVCDGEIFNAEEIRAHLRSAGRTLTGQNAVELFAHLYELE